MVSITTNKLFIGLFQATIACIAAIIFFGTDAVALENFDDSAVSTEITQVNAPPSPIMKNDSLMYSIDVFFKRLNGKFWSYPENSNRLVVIELYGLELSSVPIVFPRSSPVRKMSVKNQKTKMALSGRLSTINFDIDKGWNFEVLQPDSNSLHVSFFKKMEIKVIKEGRQYKKNVPFLSYLGAFFGAGVALCVAVIAIINK
ncbi:MAG TPA: hypothetical protein VF335_06770 [Chitinivibrionales bacterium]